MARDSKELLEVEDPAVAVLTEHLEWTELDNRNADELRPSSKKPILTVILTTKIKELNPWISDENVKRVVRNITNIPATSVIEANEKIQAMIEKGTTIMQDLDDGLGLKNRDVRLIDYKDIGKNDFHVVRQFTVKHYKENRPDIVLFINGLPIVVIECKSPTIRDAMESGMEQVFRYQEADGRFRNAGCPKLFHTTQIVVSTYKGQTKYATNLTPERHWSEWKEPHPLTLDELSKTLGRPPSSQDIFLFGVCSKENLLDLIQNFIVYEREKGRIVKKLAKYQQYRSVKKLIKRIKNRKTQKGGVIWHTQGSGKSLTMLWTAVKLRRIDNLNNPTMVIVTDRTDLDSQIKGTFERCGFPNPIQSKSASHLQELLRDPVGQTIMSTIQKFQDASDDYPVLTENENVFVLVDEAHRTQYKKLAANMRQAVTNGTFIGFTGTPISKKYRSTRDTFGDYIDIYDHKQAVKDGATVDIYYESRMPELSVSGKSVDEIFDRIFEDYSEEEKERIKCKYVTPEAIAVATQRIKLICLDALKHFESHIQSNEFKAQIVSCSRLGAIKYKKMLEDLNGPSCEVLISKHHNDEEEFIPYHKSKTEEQEIIRRFKEEKDPQIIIVCDKLLTGFDAPVEQVMYLDSPLKEHTLLQAIARVNRVYHKKRYGLIIDYWGVSQDLQDALDMFTVEESDGIIHKDFKNEILPRLQSAHNAAMNFFRDLDLNDTEACLLYLEPEDRRVTFDQRFRLFSNYMDMLFPDPAAIPFVSDLKKLAEIRTRARNHYKDDHLSLKECSHKVRMLIDEHVKAENISQLVEPTSIFTEKFDEEIEKLTSDEARASGIEHAIRHEITFKIEEDRIFYETLRDRLDRIISDFQEGRINAAEQLKLVQEVLEEMRHPEKKAQDLGVERHVMPFFNLLSKSGNDNDEMKRAASDIYNKLDGLAVVDWEFKEDIKREMRRNVKRILRATSVDRDEIEAITIKILDLARANLVR